MDHVNNNNNNNNKDVRNNITMPTPVFWYHNND